MTFRMRLLLIGLIALLTGGGLIGVASFQAARMHREAEGLIEVEQARLLSRAAIRGALWRLMEAQARFASGGADAFQAEAVRQQDTLRGLLDQAKAFMPPTGRGSHREMVDTLHGLQAHTQVLSALRTRIDTEQDTLAGPLTQEAQMLRSRVALLLERNSPESAFERRPGSRDRLRTQTETLFQIFELVRYADREALAAWRETLDHQQRQLRGLFLYLRASAGDIGERANLDKMAEQLEGFAQSLRDVADRRARMETERATLAQRRADLVDLMWEGSQALVSDIQRATLSRRVEITNRRYNMVWWLAGLGLVGGALASIFATFLVGRIERDVKGLKAVATAMERGDLSPKARIDAQSVEEMTELSLAFNKLATSLKTIRQKQIHRDSLVTGLNESVHLTEILRLSLRELIRATSAKAGCIYLKVSGREELLLAESYAVPRGAVALERVRFGEGLVGQVARDRETLLFEDVPLRSLKIVSGIVEANTGCALFVPIIFKEEMMGVIELASLNPIDHDTRLFAEESVFQIAVALNNARAIETIRTTASALEHKTRELEELNSKLERANQLKSEFLATVSHELRTPLNAIIGFTELVQARDDGMKPSSKANLDKVMSNAEQLLALITDILDLSRIEQGHVELNTTEVDLHQLVSEAVANFKPLADSKGISLVCDAEHAPRRAMVDREKFTRILQNLVSNAIKFTDEGQVGVRAWVKEARMLVEVRDTGIGIETDQLPAIFEKFRQVDGSHTRRHGGSGLGLAITKELCHSMGGSVRVTSRQGKGSVFTVNLPFVRPEHMAEEAAS